MTIQRILIHSLFVAILTPMLAGQQAPQAAWSELERHATSTCSPIRAETSVDGIPFGIWAAGPKYKMSFHDGACFIPMLGRDYPHNQPWGWRTASARVGTTELVAHQPELTYSDSRAEYDLGGIVEAYDVLPEGVEQTFVLARRPAAGDLVIRGEVTSAMTAPAAKPGHQQLAFADAEGRELFVYGKATAVDANGARRPMTTAYENGAVTLRLDADWLATASYPVVVDPLLGGGQWLAANHPTGDLDVIRAPHLQQEMVWVGMVAYASAMDGDIFLRRYDDDGTVQSAVFQRINGLENSERPVCAYVRAAGSMVLIYDQTTAFSAGVRRLSYFINHHTDYSLSTTSSLLGAPDNAWRADVGGTVLQIDGPEALVVWQQEGATGPFQESSTSRIYGAKLDLTNEVLSTPQVVGSSFFTDFAWPAVTPVSSGGNDNRWTIAWQSVYSLAASPNWDVNARQFYGDGQMSATMPVFSSTGSHEMEPRISGSGDALLVACATRPTSILGGVPTATTGTQLRVSRVDWPVSSPQGTQPFGIETVVSYPDPRARLDEMACDRQSGSHWGFTWYSTASDRVYFNTVGYRGQTLHHETVASFGNGNGFCSDAVVTYSSYWKAFLIAYGFSSSLLGDGVQTNRFEFPTVQPWTDVGVSCSPADLTWNGTQWIGSQNGYARVENAPADAVHVLALSLAQATLPLTGLGPFVSGCDLNISGLPSDFLGLFPVQIGADVQFDLPLPESLDSTTLYFQDIHTVGGGNLNLQTTEAIEVQILK